MVLELRAQAAAGGVLTGTIRIPKPLIYGEGIHVHVACLRGSIQNDGDGGKTVVNSPIWEEFYTLDRYPLGAAISEIPVFFRLPADQPASDDSLAEGRITWQLNARAKTSGVNFAATFSVPVAAGPAIAEIGTIADPTAQFRSPKPARYQLADHRIVISPMSRGGNRYEFLAGRNLKPAMFLLIFAAALVGTSIFFISQTPRGNDAFVFVFSAMWVAFSIIAGGFGLIFAGLGLYLLFQKTTVTAQRGSLTMEAKVAWIRWRKELRAAEIDQFEIKIDGSINDVPTYAIYADLKEEKPQQICGSIHLKHDAEWLAQEFKKDLLG